MALDSRVAYTGRDNEIHLTLLEDGASFGDHTQITRAVLEFGGGQTFMSPSPYLTLDSSVDSSYFDFTDATTLILKLGAATIAKGRHNVRLTVYTALLPNGATWEPMLDLKYS